MSSKENVNKHILEPAVEKEAINTQAHREVEAIEAGVGARQHVGRALDKLNAERLRTVAACRHSRRAE